MQKAVHLASILMAAMFSPPSVTSAGAEVLCQKRSGVVVVRTACKKKEVALDLAQFGAVGPKGDTGPPGPIEGVPAGGALSGTYPAPTIAAASTPTEVADNPGTSTDPCAGPTPQTAVYCGTSTALWAPVIDPQLKLWRDRLGEIRIRGTVGRVGGPAAGEVVFYLPAGSRPAEFHAFSVTVATTGATLNGVAIVFVDPEGKVRVLNASEPAFTLLYFGDIHFRTDG